MAISNTTGSNSRRSVRRPTTTARGDIEPAVAVTAPQGSHRSGHGNGQRSLPNPVGVDKNAALLLMNLSVLDYGRSSSGSNNNGDSDDRGRRLLAPSVACSQHRSKRRRATSM